MEIAFKISSILLLVSYLIATVFIYFHGYLEGIRTYFLIVFITVQVISLSCWIVGYLIRREVLREINQSN